jgi:hypothetical protein
MIKRLSPKRANSLTFLGLAALLYFVFHEYNQATRTGNYYVVILLIVAFLYLLRNYFHIGTLSYDEEKVFIDKFFYKVTIPIENITKIKRSIGSVLYSTNLDFGYRLIYLTQKGKKNYFTFFVQYNDVTQLKEFVSTVIKKNPAVFIDLKE